MPDPGDALHVASVDYACTFGTLPEDGGAISFSCPDPVHFLFTFETGTTPVGVGVVQVTWDYSWFNQPEIEAGIAQALDTIVAAVATLLDVPLSVVNASVTVTRVWTTAPNVQGAGVGTGRIATIDYMDYPVTKTDSDAVTAADGGETAGPG
jgi:hypothetical protein